MRRIKDKGVYLSAKDWQKLRADPAFIELMRLARVTNSLSLAWGPLLISVDDQSPSARRDRFAAMVYAGALLHEGLHTAQGLGKHFRDLPQYRKGFASILGDAEVVTYRSRVLDRLRDELVFHTDRDAIAKGLAQFPDGEALIVTAADFEQGRIYYDAADDALLGSLFGDASSEAEYQSRVSEFLERTTDLFSRFMKAAHSLLPAALRRMGAYGKPAERPLPPPDDAG